MRPWLPRPGTYSLAVEPDRRESVHFRSNNPFWYYAYLYLETGLSAAQVQRITHPFKGATHEASMADRLPGRGARTNLALGRPRRRAFRAERRGELLKRYEPDIRKTGDLIGVDLRPWAEGKEIAVE